MSTYYVYIMTNRRRRLCIGVTNDLDRRVHEHKQRLIPGLTNTYHLNRLVYFEQADDASAASARKKQFKGRLRSRKIGLIEAMNPTWSDLSRAQTTAKTESLRGDPPLSLRMTTIERHDV